MSDWIWHSGKGMPVGETDVVECKLRDGTVSGPWPALEFDWESDGGLADVLFWRNVSQSNKASTKQEKQMNEWKVVKKDGIGGLSAGDVVEIQRESGRYDRAAAEDIKWNDVIAYRVIESAGSSAKQTKATDILAAAAKHMADRAETYDKPEGERSMDAAVRAFNAVCSRDLTESEGWLLLACLKAVRLFSKPGYHQDSAEDAVSYMALLAESKSKEAA